MISRAFLIAFAGLALWAAPALAQMMPVGSFVQGAFPVLCQGATSGPGDCGATFTAWYSGTRAYSAAVAATGTQPAVDLRRVSDSATCTALIGTDGNVDLTVGTPCNSSTQTVTAWIGGSTARVTKLYDQTNGNACGGASCDFVQATTSAQPQFLLTGCGVSGTLPCILSDGATGQGDFLQSANNFTVAGTTMSLAAVAKQHHITGGVPSAIMKASGGSSGGGVNDSICNSSNTGKVCLAGTATFDGTATDAVYHSILGIIQGVGSILSIDGTETTSPLTLGTTASQPFTQNKATAGSATDNINFGEGGWQDNAVWSVSTRTALCHNMRLYWGTAGSC